MIRVKPLTRKQRAPLERWLGCEIRETVTKPVTKAVTKQESVTKGRPRIYVTQAEKQKAYRERKRGSG